ncbi:hypothetical protein [Nonomuraea basaltis]|uniref:hypothetical protein n=1 Tax=Nonomuraea basaltis TaxID=2495887 RepID=UPI00110C6AFC|nr:hypothetical protein [Nonomuraea basaltis]TMR90506.1 hypothetical protein EJK15_54975 [Nonomuraea basaltis]
MTVPFTTPDQQVLYRERAWRAFDRITAADEAPSATAPCWRQAEFRTQCGTGCCYAGHVALGNGGQWLVDIRGDDMFIDGMAINPDVDEELSWAVWEYMLAEPDDPEDAIEEAYGKRVVHVSNRAERLLGSPRRCHYLFFNGSNSRARLERLITEHIGPRVIVGGTAN